MTAAYRQLLKTREGLNDIQNEIEQTQAYLNKQKKKRKRQHLHLVNLAVENGMQDCLSVNIRKLDVYLERGIDGYGRELVKKK